MDTLLQYVCARSARRMCGAVLAAMLLCVAGAGCQHSMRNLASVPYEPQIGDADGVLFESQRRYVAVQWMEAPLDGIIDSDSFITYLSLPLDRKTGFDFGDPGLGIAWSDASLLFTGMFDPKVAFGQWLPWEKATEAETHLNTEHLLELSLERNTIYDYKIWRDLDPGRRLQILDYASLKEPEQVAQARPNPENPSTD